MTDIKDSDFEKLRDVIKKHTNEQQLLLDKINLIKEEKVKNVIMTINNIIDKKKIEKVSKILVDIQELLAKANESHSASYNMKMQNLCKRGLYRIVPDRILLTDKDGKKILFKDDRNNPHYYYGYKGHQIVWNIKGLAYMPNYGDRSVYIESISDLKDIIKNNPILETFIKNPIKKEAYDIVKKYIMKFKGQPKNYGYKVDSLEVDLTSSPIYTLKQNSHSIFGINNIGLDKWKRIKLQNSYYGTELSLTKDGNYYNGYKVDCKSPKREDDIVFSQLSDDYINTLIKTRDALKKGCNDDKKIYEKFEKEIKPFVMIYDI